MLKCGNSNYEYSSLPTCLALWSQIIYISIRSNPTRWLWFYFQTNGQHKIQILRQSLNMESTLKRMNEGGFSRTPFSGFQLTPLIGAKIASYCRRLTEFLPVWQAPENKLRQRLYKRIIGRMHGARGKSLSVLLYNNRYRGYLMMAVSEIAQLPTRSPSLLEDVNLEDVIPQPNLITVQNFIDIP